MLVHDDLDVGNISQAQIDELCRKAAGIIRSAAAKMGVSLDILDTATDAVYGAISSKLSDPKIPFGKTMIALCYQAVGIESKQVSTSLGKDDSSEGFDLLDVLPGSDLRDAILESDNPDFELTSTAAENRRQSEKEAREDQYQLKLEQTVMSIKSIYSSASLSRYEQEFFIKLFINKQSISSLAKETRQTGKTSSLSIQKANAVKTQILEKLSKTINFTKEQLDATLSHLLPALRILGRLSYTYSDSSAAQIFHNLQGTPSISEARDFIQSSELDAKRYEPHQLPQGNPKQVRIFLQEMMCQIYSEIDNPPLESTALLLRPYQREKILKLTSAYLNAESGDDIFIDIAPPSAGKTWMQATLAKLALKHGARTIFVTHSNSVIEGQDGAYKTFLQVCGESNVGIVNSEHHDYSAAIILTTYQSLTSDKVLAQLYNAGPAIRVLLMDEGDLGQTNLRLEAIKKLRDASGALATFAFSATLEVSGRNLANKGKVTDVMTFTDLIAMRMAKHILGFDVPTNIAFDKKNAAVNSGELNFDSYRLKEKQALISIPVQIYCQHHRGEQALIHCASISQAKSVAHQLEKLGVKSACLTSKDNNKRGKIQDSYIEKRVQVLVSCKKLDRGFSENGVTDVEIYATFSQSPTKLYQAITRGTRPREGRDILLVYQLLPSSSFSKVSRITDVITLETWDSLFGPTSDITSTKPSDIRDQIEDLIRSGDLTFASATAGTLRIKSDSIIEVGSTSPLVVEQKLDTRTLLWTENNQEVLRQAAKVFLAEHGELNTLGPSLKASVNFQGISISWHSLLVNFIELLAPPGLITKKSDCRQYYKDGIRLIKKLRDNQAYSLSLARADFASSITKAFDLEYYRKLAQLFHKSHGALSATNSDIIKTVTADNQRISWHSLLTGLVVDLAPPEVCPNKQAARKFYTVAIQTIDQIRTKPKISAQEIQKEFLANLQRHIARNDFSFEDLVKIAKLFRKAKIRFSTTDIRSAIVHEGQKISLEILTSHFFRLLEERPKAAFKESIPDRSKILKIIEEILEGKCDLKSAQDKYRQLKTQNVKRLDWSFEAVLSLFRKFIAQYGDKPKDRDKIKDGQGTLSYPDFLHQTVNLLSDQKFGWKESYPYRKHAEAALNEVLASKSESKASAVKAYRKYKKDEEKRVILDWNFDNISKINTLFFKLGTSRNLLNDSLSECIEYQKNRVSWHTLLTEATLLFGPKDRINKRAETRALHKYTIQILTKMHGNKGYTLQNAKSEFKKLLEADQRQFQWSFENLRLATKVFLQECKANQSKLSTSSITFMGQKISWETLLIEAAIVFSKENFEGKRRAAKPFKKFASVVLQRAAYSSAYSIHTARKEFQTLVEEDKIKISWDYTKLKSAILQFKRESATKGIALSYLTINFEGQELSWGSFLAEGAIVLSEPGAKIAVHKMRGYRSFAREILEKAVVTKSFDLALARKEFARLIAGAG